MRISVLGAVAAILVSSTISVKALADPATTIAQMPCDMVSDTALTSFGRGGVWFGIPVHQWSPEIFDKLIERAVFCLNQRTTGRISSTMGPKELASLIRAIQSSRRYDIETAARKEQFRTADAQRATRERDAAEAAKRQEAERLLAAAQQDGLSASELSSRLAALSAASTTANVGAETARRLESEIAQLKRRLDQTAKAEADAWERDRPAREAKAATDAAEIARLEAFNKERAEFLEAERARAARLEQLKAEAARMEQQRVAQVEADKRAAERAESDAAARAAKIAAAKAEEEEMKKPLSCGNLPLKLKAAGPTVAKQQNDMMSSVMMGDRKTTCQSIDAIKAAIKPLHEMAIQCRDVGIGYSLNSMLVPLNDLAVEQRC